MQKDIIIRKAVQDDVEAIFFLYADYMFDSYLLRFGDIFVKRYLRLIVRSRNCSTLVAAGDGIKGFIMAAFDSRKIMFELLLDTRLIREWLRQVLLRPVLALRSIELFFYPFLIHPKDINAEFLFISIEPAFRKTHLATRLIGNMIDLMKQKGIKKIKVSAIAANEAVNALLKKLAFKIEKTFTLFNKDMYLYSLNLLSR